jgi:thioester reductase-like protein
VERERLRPRLLIGSLQLGAAPDLTLAIPMIPVDFAAEAIVALARRPPSGETFHLLGAIDQSWLSLVDSVQEAGWKLDLLPYAQWWDRLAATCDYDHENVLTTLLETLDPRSGLGSGQGTLSFDMTSTRALLEQVGLVEPPFLTSDFLKSAPPRDLVANRTVF